MYGSEIRIWKEKDDSRAVQMDNLKVLLGNRKMDKVPDVWIRKLCRVTKWGCDERIDEGVFQWLGH